MSEKLPGKLLIRGVNWLGDTVMTTPALLRLREALPSTHIALLTRAKLAELWTSHPAIDELIAIQPGESVWEVGGRLRAADFDTALVLPNSPRSVLEIWMAGIPRRIGYRRPWRSWFLTDAIPTRPGHVKMHKRGVAEIRQRVSGPGREAAAMESDPSRVSRSAHQMHEYLHLAAALGASEEPLAPRLAVTESEVGAALAKFEIPGDGVWLGLNAGAEYGPAKRWPKDRFIAAALMVQQSTGCGCLVFGGQGDARLGDDISAAIHKSGFTVHNLVGRTSLRELMALMSRCRAVLTNDTGPMHVAAALGVAVVVPFGSTSPDLTGPGLAGAARHRLIRSDAPCSPCFLRQCPIDFRCMTGISVDRVAAAVMEALSSPS